LQGAKQSLLQTLGKVGELEAQNAILQRKAAPAAAPELDKAYGKIPQIQTSVEVNLRLNIDFQAAGLEGSIQRENFIKDLTQDLADASGMGASGVSTCTFVLAKQVFLCLQRITELCWCQISTF